MKSPQFFIPLFLFGGSGISFCEEAKLTAPNAGSFDRFGQAVAMTADYLIVGAHREDTGASSAGSVYVYSRANSTFLRTLNASDPGINHFFGWSLSAKGNRVLVGSPGNNSGAAYLFDLETGTELKKFLPADPANGDQFGHSVALSPTHVLVGAWLEEENDNDPSENSGAAYLFSATSYAQLHRFQPEDLEDADQFGGSVALTADYACIGSLFDNHSSKADAGSVYLYDLQTGNEARKIISTSPQEGDVFGTAIAAKDDLLVVGASEADAQGDTSGAAYLYRLSTGSLIAGLLPPNGEARHRIGNTVAIADKIVVGAFRSPVENASDAGAAHLFDTNGTYQNTLTSSDFSGSDFFGHSVATSGSQCLIGAVQDDDFGSSSGSAYLFTSTAPPKLENLTIFITNSGTTLHWLATPDASYSIFATSELNSWPATPVGVVTPTGENGSYHHATTSPKNFYRVTSD